MILHTLPHLKPGWKEFKQEAERSHLEESMEKYQGLEVIEHLFISFIECGNICSEEMIRIMAFQKTIDLENRGREYAYTEEELRFY